MTLSIVRKLFAIPHDVDILWTGNCCRLMFPKKTESERAARRRRGSDTTWIHIQRYRKSYGSFQKIIIYSRIFNPRLHTAESQMCWDVFRKGINIKTIKLSLRSGIFPLGLILMFFKHFELCVYITEWESVVSQFPFSVKTIKVTMMRSTSVFYHHSVLSHIYCYQRN